MEKKEIVQLDSMLLNFSMMKCNCNERAGSMKHTRIWKTTFAGMNQATPIYSLQSKHCFTQHQ